MTPSDVRRALRLYTQHRAELEALAEAAGYPSHSIPRVGRGGWPSDPTGRAAVKLAGLWAKCQAVEAWLRRLHDIAPALRIAAGPWVGETLTDDVAERLGLSRREAQGLTEAVPYVLWAVAQEDEGAA